MAWLAVSSYGAEYMFHTMPTRAANCMWNAKHKIMPDCYLRNGSRE